MKFIDIAVNLMDPMFRGEYRGKQKHEDDLEDVLRRSNEAGVERIIITGTSLKESQEALEYSKKADYLTCTIGVHPTRCGDFESDPNGPDAHYQQLLELSKQGQEEKKVVAVGECGLDYDRTEFCPREVQRQYFERQIQIAKELRLPMFLHCRNAGHDLAEILRPHREKLSAAVVHSFDGTLEELQLLLDLDLYIGINGCSLKKEENLEVLKHIPLDKLLLETDAPWCDVRNTHASSKFVRTKFNTVKPEKFIKGEMVKGRNEPCTIRQVFEVVAGVRGVEDEEQLAAQIYNNTIKLFFPEES